VHTISDVIVFLESSGERAEKINRGLLAQGRRIADLLGGSLSALCEESSDYDIDALARSARKILENTPFRLLLFAHTGRSTELAPLIALNLGAPAVLDCFEMRLRENTLYFARHLYDGQFEQEITFANPPEIASLNLASVKEFESAFSEPCEVRTIQPDVPFDVPRKTIIETIPPDFRTIDIRYAKRILDIGSGCNQPELQQLAEELSELLEASVATTKPMADDGHISKSRMIGETGKAVSPEILLALGVSGSPHHLAGMREAGTILSVNSDGRAPILGISDTGFIADLNTLLPKLVDRLKLYRDKDLP
jgi:electron transfer flavoprotein alpha subunit